MQFVWDDNKNESNFEKHGFSFEEAENLFNEPVLVSIDTRAEYGETRFRALGQLQGTVIVLIFARPDDQTCRCISLRRANLREKLNYENYLENRLG